MWACEGLSAEGVSGICEGTQKPEAWELPQTERMKPCLRADTFVSFTGASCQALVSLSHQQSRLEWKGLHQKRGACLSLLVGVSLYLQKTLNIPSEFTGMTTRGRPENERASFLSRKTWVLLLSSPSSASHCAIHCSSISCFTQELCKDFWIV